ELLRLGDAKGSNLVALREVCGDDGERQGDVLVRLHPHLENLEADAQADNGVVTGNDGEKNPVVRAVMDDEAAEIEPPENRSDAVSGPGIRVVLVDDHVEPAAFLKLQ